MRPQTSGLTGADLANICNEAAIFCARRKGQALSSRDFDDALERVIAGVQSIDDAQRPRAPRRRLPRGRPRAVPRAAARRDRVHKISIVPRGRALGYVVNLPDEDCYLKTREELIDQMTVLLGGRVAEQIVFGAVTTGAANDLQRVAEITRAMVHEYAMGRSAETANRAITDAEAVSDLTRRIRDEEQQELAFEAHRMATLLITRHRDRLEVFAAELLAHEVLERARHRPASWTGSRRSTTGACRRRRCGSRPRAAPIAR